MHWGGGGETQTLFFNLALKGKVHLTYHDIMAVEITTGDKVIYFTADVNGGFDGRSDVIQMQVLSVHESSTRGHQ